MFKEIPECYRQQQQWRQPVVLFQKVVAVTADMTSTQQHCNRRVSKVSDPDRCTEHPTGSDQTSLVDTEDHLQYLWCTNTHMHHVNNTRNKIIYASTVRGYE